MSGQWEQALAADIFAKGEDRPNGLEIVFDSGADGCMPAGWYAVGTRNGWPLTWPVRHEYGPFRTAVGALRHVDRGFPGLPVRVLKADL